VGIFVGEGIFRGFSGMGNDVQLTRQASAYPRIDALRRGVRDVVVGLSSLGVLALLVAYAVAAPTAELTATVGKPVPRPGATAVVQGRVLTPEGDAIEGAQVEVRRPGATGESDVSADDGRFRVELSGGCAVYVISLRADAAGSRVGTDSTRRICPGDAVPVLARLVTHGHFIWVPGPR
jgi:hypothetical protein